MKHYGGRGCDEDEAEPKSRRRKMEEDAIMAEEDQSSMWWSIAEDGRCDEDEAGPKSPNRKVNTKQYSSQRIAQHAHKSLNRWGGGYIVYSDPSEMISSIS